MSLWSWVLIGLAAWLAPAVVAGLMFGWALFRDPEKRARRPKPPQDGQPPSGS
jgi:hypothetical protein